MCGEELAKSADGGTLSELLGRFCLSGSSFCEDKTSVVRAV